MVCKQASADHLTLVARLFLSSASECAYKQAKPAAITSNHKLRILVICWEIQIDSSGFLTKFAFPLRIEVTPASKDPAGTKI